VATPWPQNQVSSYVDRHADEVLSWWMGDVGRYINQFWPMAFGADLPSFSAFGFASNGGPNEDTSTSAAHAAFAELGLFGVSAGPWNLPHPNTDRGAENQWADLYASPLVREMLHRAACMTPGCWLPASGGLPDQIAVGIVSLVVHYQRTVAALPEALRPTKASSWQSAIMNMGWSAGDSRAARILSAAPQVKRLDDGRLAVTDARGALIDYADSVSDAQELASAVTELHTTELAQIPEEKRFAQINRLYAISAYESGFLGPQLTYDNTEHACNRTQQKIRSGARLAGQVVGPNAETWWLQGYESADEMLWIETVLAAAASGINPRSVVGPRPAASGPSAVANAARGVGAAVVAGGVVWAAWQAWKAAVRVRAMHA